MRYHHHHHLGHLVTWSQGFTLLRVVLTPSKGQRADPALGLELALDQGPEEVLELVLGTIEEKEKEKEEVRKPEKKPPPLPALLPHGGATESHLSRG